MKRKVKELKRIARGNLTGNYSVLIKAFLWVNALPLLIQFPFYLLQTSESYSTQNIIYLIAEVLISILSIVLVCGQYKMHLSVARTGTADSKDLFEPFRNQPDRYILTNFILFGISLVCLIPSFISLAIIHFLEGLTWILVALILSILSIILVLYVSLTFDLVFCLLVDEPNLTPVEALKAIYGIIRTHRKRYLYMQLSFLGLQFVNLLSFGIGTLWISPYITQTTVLFYLDTKGVLDAIQTERRKMETPPEPTMFNQYV